MQTCAPGGAPAGCQSCSESALGDVSLLCHDAAQAYLSFAAMTRTGLSIHISQAADSCGISSHSRHINAASMRRLVSAVTDHVCAMRDTLMSLLSRKLDNLK